MIFTCYFEGIAQLNVAILGKSSIYCKKVFKEWIYQYLNTGKGRFKSDRALSATTHKY